MKTKITILILILILCFNFNSGIISKEIEKNSYYDFLIISPSKFIKPLENLVEHKCSYQISTKLISLETVYKEIYWQGRDNQEKIKYFIKNAIEQWGIRYVLLVGGRNGQSYSWNFPVRYSRIYDNTFFYPEEKFISDLYFADIFDDSGNFSHWDMNNNGLHGEWVGKSSEDYNIDLNPDVSIGRLPCRNVIEVKIMVNKIIEYEKNAYGKKWFNNIITVGGDSYPQKNTPYNKSYGNEGEDVAKNIIENMSAFNPINLWTSDESLTCERDVINAINQGCGFLYFHGHTNTNVFSTHPTNNNSSWINGLSNKNMIFLTNRNMLPICVIHGCKSNQFDVTPLNIVYWMHVYGIDYFRKDSEKPGLFHYYCDWVPKCLSWKLTSLSHGGSIATIGCTGLGKTREDKDSFEETGELIDKRFFWEIGTNGTQILGDAWKESIEWYLDQHDINWNSTAMSDSAHDVKTVQQWILFGDPTLKIGGYP